MQAKTRADYDGEYVLTKTTIRDGEKTHKREWMSNPIVNQHISGRAAVIGSDTDSVLFDYRKLAQHRGGLLGSKRLQTYGSGPIWKDMALNFYVSTNRENLEELKASGYHKTNIVYSTTGVILKNPGDFYLVPFVPVLDELALAVYLAAFDGHKEIFLFGYNNDVSPTRVSWQSDVNRVFRAYPDVRFTLVGVDVNQPEGWRANSNVQCMTYRDAISYCDI
jgi:hypothetical protein